MKEFLRQLENDKIKIKWNKNPIPMSLFLSFLKVETERSSNHLGSCNGWTKLHGDGGLIIKGGVVRGLEYLDSLRYGKNLDNPYNNFINPFYLFDILTDEGQDFFVDYYKKEIQDILKSAEAKATEATADKERLFIFWAGHGVEISCAI